MGGNATKNYVDRRASGGGGGGGTTNYNELENKPSINGVALSGNKTSADLNISSGGLPDFENLKPVFLCNFKKGNTNYKIYRMWFYNENPNNLSGMDFTDYITQYNIINVFNFSIVGYELSYPKKPDANARFYISYNNLYHDSTGLSNEITGYIDFIANA